MTRGPKALDFMLHGLLEAHRSANRSKFQQPVRERSIAVEQRAGLDKLVAAIDKAASGEDGKVPHLARIEDLNKARVGFKHAGTAPARVDAERLVRFGVEFLEVAFPRFFAVEYRLVSVAYQVRAAEVRGHLLEAERCLREGAFYDAIVEAADAVSGVEQVLGNVLPPVSRANIVGDNDPGVINYLNGLRLISLAGLVGYDPRALMRFRGLAPTVLRGVGGSRQVLLNGPPNQYRAEHADFAIKFATDFALAVQKRLG
jgi:hypothetical protein